MADTTAPIPISFGEEESQPQEKLYNMDHGKVIDLTHEAILKVKSFIAGKPEQTEGKLFRINVEGGGCSGMQYGFTFDTPKETDYVVDCEDIQVLIDREASVFIKGAVVDYIEDFRGSGFVVKNPQSKGECGCGLSFTV